MQYFISEIAHKIIGNIFTNIRIAAVDEKYKKEGEIDMALLEVKNVKKIYTTRFGGNKVEALRDVNFSVEPGEYVAIMGESGSGKSTLLNILAQLDRPTSGKVILKGRDLSTIKEKEMSAFRRQNLGFVFQDFHLLDTFTLKDNIFLPLVLSGRRKKWSSVLHRSRGILVLKKFWKSIRTKCLVDRSNVCLWQAS